MCLHSSSTLVEVNGEAYRVCDNGDCGAVLKL